MAMRVFHHVDDKMELIWFSETGKLVIGFTNGGSISIVLSPEKRKALSKALWYSEGKKA